MFDRALRSDLFYDSQAQGDEPKESNFRLLSAVVCQHWLLRTRHTEVAQMGIVKVDHGRRSR